MKRFIPWALWAGAIIAIAVALLIWESELLWKVQHLNLFLFSSLFFKQQMIVPGGFLSYLGTFFTQFFYYPWLGVMLLCGWWLLLTWVTKRTFRIADRWNALALLPVHSRNRPYCVNSLSYKKFEFVWILFHIPNSKYQNRLFV